MKNSTSAMTTERLVISMSGKLAHIAKVTTSARVRTLCGVTMIGFRVSREKCAANGWTICVSCQVKARS